MGGRYEVVKSFGFEAAHYLPYMPDDHRYRRVHGHSFRVEVAIAGEPDPEHGWIVDFEVLAARLEEIRGTLDHNLLNEVEGLAAPTLEALAAWIAGRLAPDFPGLTRVTVSRPSCGEACTYRPD